MAALIVKKRSARYARFSELAHASSTRPVFEMHLMNLFAGRTLHWLIIIVARIFHGTVKPMVDTTFSVRAKKRNGVHGAITHDYGRDLLRG